MNMQGIPADATGEVVGDTYWDIHWSESAVLLEDNDKIIEGYVTRYDIQKDEFEFKVNNGVKVISGNLVKNVAWLDSLVRSPRYLVNAKGYRKDGVPLTGFFEVLADGNNALFKKLYLEILKPNYNAALHNGTKDTRIIKKQAYFYNIGKNVFKIKSRKSFNPLFKDKAPQMDAFTKKEKLKFNSEADLIKLFNYFSYLK